MISDDVTPFVRGKIAYFPSKNTQREQDTDNDSEHSVTFRLNVDKKVVDTAEIQGNVLSLCR